MKKNLQLSGKAASYLRGLGHHLSPLVMLGKEGISDNLIASLEAVLTAHELVKVKIQESCPLDRKAAAEELAGKTRSRIVQEIGRVALLYRANKDLPEDKQIKLPGK